MDKTKDILVGGERDLNDKNYISILYNRKLIFTLSKFYCHNKLNMLIVNIKNGLGNQMFQYAFGRVLEWKYGVSVLYHFFGESEEHPRKTGLDVFSINEINEPKNDIVEPFKPFSVRRYRDERRYVKYIYYKLRRVLQKNRLITEQYPSQFQRCFENLDVDKMYFFLGFWQNPLYFRGYEDEIKKIFIPRDKSVYSSDIALEITNSVFNTVGLHIRRGDYLTSGFIEPTDMDYYSKAIEHIQKTIAAPYFYIFTDEPQWVREEFKFDIPYKLVTANVGSDSYKDIILMSLCEHNIIANSSFSWWGAWLNSNQDKMVIAPKKWYASAQRDRYAAEITPKDWIRL
ncbi:MAG TPA: alpha-1,2-fucosyltransferase [Clostridia bacterium]|nr:alpha-1,2-fucosyltransferase [Clostridia bacterium]